MVKIIIEDLENEYAEHIIKMFSSVENVDLAINAGSDTQSVAIEAPVVAAKATTSKSSDGPRGKTYECIDCGKKFRNRFKYSSHRRRCDQKPNGSDVKPTKQQPKTWKFDYSVLDNKEREIQNKLIQSFNDRGASWSEMGKYLGVRADTLRKRISVHQTRGVKKANKEFKKRLPEFVEISNEELVGTVYGMVTATAGKPNMIITATSIANLIGGNLRNTYKMTPYLNKYCMQLESRIVDIFENIGKILGIAKCMFTRANNESGQISGQLMFYSTDFMDLGDFSYVYRRLE